MNKANSDTATIVQALGHWLIYVIILFLFGGIVAGLTWLAFIGIFNHEISDVMYAVIFGFTGYIAVLVLQPVIEAKTRAGQ